MLTTAKPAYGSALQREDPATPGSFLNIPNVSNINPSGNDMKFAETSHMAGGGWDEHTPTLNSAGTITCDMDFDYTNAVHQQLVQDQKNRTLVNFRRVYPDASYAAIQGYVKSTPADLKVNDVVKSKLVIQLTGPGFTN